MASKQLWECSNKVLSLHILLISLLLFSESLFGGTSSSKTTADQEMPEENFDEFGGYDSAFLESAYAASPSDVRYIINFLKDPHYALGEEDRFAVFYGQPGTGKTVQSLVVPYKARWRCVNRVPNQVQVKERNGTARNIGDDIAKALEPGEKVVYIMQEFNKLIDHPKSTNHDADTASAALWNALDQNNKNPRFYFIGTTDNLEYIADQLKDKFIPQIIEFQGMQTLEEKKRSFIQHVFSNRVYRADCADEFLDTIISPCSPSSLENNGSENTVSSPFEDMVKLYSCSTHRDFRALGILARKFARFDNPTGYNATLTSQHITKAVERMRRARKLCCYGQEEETDQEQRERHHTESLKQQELHHQRTIDQNYQFHGLNVIQDIIQGRYTTSFGSISNLGN